MEGDGQLADRVHARLTPRELKSFGRTVGGAFLVIAAILWWRGRLPAAVVTGTLGAMLVLVGEAMPGLLAPVQRGWMALGLLLSRVTNPIVLGAIYFLGFTPIGYVMRAMGRNPMRDARAEPSAWARREKRPNPKDQLERQF